MVKALVEAAHGGPPNIPPLPKSFEHYRVELGAEVYGAMAIPPDDKVDWMAARMRNFEFFHAPLAGIICMHRDLGPPDAVSVGSFFRIYYWP